MPKRPQPTGMRQRARRKPIKPDRFAPARPTPTTRKKPLTKIPPRMSLDPSIRKKKPKRKLGRIIEHLRGLRKGGTVKGKRGTQSGQTPRRVRKMKLRC